MKGKEVKKIVLTTAVLLALCNNIYALDFLGQPSGELESSESQIGFVYSKSEADILTDDDIGDFSQEKIKIKDIDFLKRYFVFSLAFDERIEVSLRLGSAQAEPDRKLNTSNFAGHLGESDNGLLIGGGAKLTLYNKERFKWGLSAQFSAADYEFDQTDFQINSVNYHSFETRWTLYEAMISTGPTLIINDSISAYGGPFLHFIRGETELDATIDTTAAHAETDIREDSIIGGFVGIEFNFGGNLSLNIEGQRTNSASGIAGSIAFRF